MSGTTVTPQLNPIQQEDDHEDFGLLMSLALDNMLDADEKQALNLHLTSCQPCSRQWQLWQTISHQFELPPMLLPPTNFAQQIESRLESREKGREFWVGLLLAFLTLALWAIGLAGVGILVGFLIYSQIGAFGEVLHQLTYISTMARVFGESAGRALIGLGENPSAIRALVGYIALAVASLMAWMQFLRRSIRPWGTQSF